MARALTVGRPAPVATAPMALIERAAPTPGAGELRVAVEVCGVCRTDLHVIEGDLPPRRSPVVPGHEVVGRVDQLGAGVGDFAIGDRVGIAWLRATCGRCRFCRRGDENLCLAPRFTGYDEDGGYADYACVPAAFAYRLPEALAARELAPLLCAGIIGYRAYRRSGARRGARVGLYGFGASAHIVMQLARHDGAEVYVATRGPRHRQLASAMGATWVGEATEPPPVPLDAAILFAPAGELVPVALAALDRGGTLAVAGIHLSAVPALDYQRHLFQERNLVSVTANTRADGHALLRLAAEIPLRCATEVFPLADAHEALRRLRHDEIAGAAVLEVGATRSD